jgi:benzil reductase ((S)-benzoin forming)
LPDPFFDLEQPMKAILTGHTRGLGQAIAADLLGRGIPVLALARSDNAELAQAFPELLQQQRVDLADPAAVQTWLTGDTLRRYAEGAAELLLVNNAGMLGPVAPLGRQDPADLVRTVNLNVTAALLLSDAVARSHTGPLRICHVSSGAARSAFASWSVYGATKAALDHHARSVTEDGRWQLRICSLAPGVVDTDMQAAIRSTSEQDFPLLDRFLALKDEGKLSSPAEAAGRMVRYLLSEDFARTVVADLRDL